jgi:hypothetical protein
MLGKHSNVSHSRDELEGLGHHVGCNNRCILSHAPQDMAQCQRGTQGITVGRLVARDSNAVHSVDEFTQLIDDILVNDRTNHKLFSSH